MKRKKNLLPDKPSELLRVALTDLEKTVAMPEKYEINMQIWHQPDSDDKKCYVCLAGSVLAQTCKVPWETDGWENLISSKDENKIYALNLFRVGEYEAALEYLGFFPSPIPNYYSPPVYRTDPQGFKDYLCDLIGIFEAEGL
jgi:hypothetical protein